MQKIRIKKTPKPGDQQDYSLVGRNVSFTGDSSQSTNIKNTMGATSKEDANIEVEGGETVVGDINKDGFLEHFTFVGKKHSNGGMPVNIPEGSFIFSDTKKLKIKDKEVLEGIFGLKEKKGGYTPAEIAKKYQINQFVQDLKSEDTDPIQKRSAAEMLKKNTEKLGMLALVQESLKGFPDGIPAIAESVMAGLGGAEMPGMEKGEGAAHEMMEGQEGAQENEQSEGMKYGGSMKKYPDGGLVNGRPTKGYVVYIGNTPVKVKSADVSTTLEFPYRKDYIVLENGERFTQAEFDKMQKGEPLKRTHTSKSDMPSFSSSPVTTYSAQPRIQSRTIKDGSGSKTKLSISTGDKLQYKGETYEVVNPYGESSKDYVGSWKAVRDKFDDTQGIITVKDSKGNITYLEGEDIGDLYNIAKDQVVVTPKAYLRSTAPAAPAAGTGKVDQFGNPIAAPAASNPNQGTKYTVPGNTQFEYTREGDQWKYRNKQTGATGVVTTPASLQSLNQQIGVKPETKASTETSTPPKTNTAPRPASGSKPKTAQEALNYFAMGGSILKKFQEAGTQNVTDGEPDKGTLNTTVATKEQAAQNANQKIDPNQEIFVGNITLEDGTVLKAYYKGSQKYVKDASGNILAQGPRTDNGGFEQYGSQNINQILSKAQNVKYTTTNFGTFARQPNVKGTGIYLSSGNANARQSGDLSPEEWQDFKERHGDWIDKEYKSASGTGFEAFQKDLRSGKAQGDKASGWYQDAINEKSMKQFGVPYFAPLGSNKETNPYFRDSKFGQVTYSVPRFFDAPETPQKTPPGEEMAYYCVERTDGSKNVISVSHKTGEAPIPPSGPDIKSVSSGSKDKAVTEGQCINVKKGEFEKTPKKEGPWWLQDIVNYVGTMTDKVNRYEPTQGKLDLVTPGYDLLDPTRKLAANQEQMSRFQTQVENTADGNVGLATVLGSSGEGFANAANVLDTTEAANIGIVNQAYGTNAQIQNQEIVGNENARQKYVEDMATLNQQYDNALQQKKWRQIAAFNNGTTNWFRKKQMENVLFPQVYIDPILGDVDFSGQGRQILEEDGTGLAPDVYQNQYTAGTRGNAGYDPSTMTQTANAAWKKAYDESVGTRGEEEARKYATQVSNMYLQTAKQTPTWKQGFQNAYMSGMTTPGAFNATPWDDQGN